MPTAILKVMVLFVRIFLPRMKRLLDRFVLKNIVGISFKFQNIPA